MWVLMFFEVFKVIEYKKKSPDEYRKFMYEYNQANLAAKLAFELNQIDRIKYTLEKSWHLRKQLGKIAGAPIEDDNLTRLMSDMKKNGAFTAGLIGAGGGDTILALTTSQHERKKLLAFLDDNNLEVLDDISFTNKGYEIVK